MSNSSYSGTNYDRWSYEQAAKGGTLADTPINRLQHKYWVAKQKVTKKLGKEEDQHIVASDSDLDAKLELFKSIHATTCRLQGLIENYQDRIYYLAGEENALGRFLKEQGKLDKTRAGKMMVAAGKTMSYTGQQRLAIRVPLVRLYQEVDTFRQRAIEDMKLTVDHMERVRTEYRGALLWMKNVSTELDPDTFRQLEKFRKVQIHVRDSKKRFDKLAVDVLQKIDLLAASRCNMFSHALIMYQNTLVIFWDKTSKTMNHVNNGFKGYQYYEFSYIKDLAAPNREVANNQRKMNNSQDSCVEEIQGDLVDLDNKQQSDDGAKKAGETQEDGWSMHNLLDLSAPSSAPTLGDDDEVLLKIDSELAEATNQADNSQDFNKIFAQSKLKSDPEDDDLLNLGDTSQECLDRLMDDGQQGAFTKEWDQHLTNNPSKDSGGFSDWGGQSSGFLPSQLFEIQAGRQEQNLMMGLNQPLGGSPLFPQHKSAHSRPNIPASLAGQPMSGAAAATSATSREKDIAQWFSLFAELDPLSNPDKLGAGTNKDCL